MDSALSNRIKILEENVQALLTANTEQLAINKKLEETVSILVENNSKFRKIARCSFLKEIDNVSHSGSWDNLTFDTQCIVWDMLHEHNKCTFSKTCKEIKTLYTNEIITRTKTIPLEKWEICNSDAIKTITRAVVSGDWDVCNSCFKKKGSLSLDDYGNLFTAALKYKRRDIVFLMYRYNFSLRFTFLVKCVQKKKFDTLVYLIKRNAMVSFNLKTVVGYDNFRTLCKYIAGENAYYEGILGLSVKKNYTDDESMEIIRILKPSIAMVKKYYPAFKKRYLEELGQDVQVSS